MTSPRIIQLDKEVMLLCTVPRSLFFFIYRKIPRDYSVLCKFYGYRIMLEKYRKM